MSISDQLRDAIRNSGKSASVMAQECGVPQPTMTRFLAGADTKASAIDRLAAYFGLMLRPDDGKAAKSKVKAPAMPAVDWATAEPKPKAKAIPMPGGQVREKAKSVKRKSR